MMRSRWRQDIRLELMREASGQTCRRCDAPIAEPDSQDEAICYKCQYLDWHEEIPEVLPEEEVA